MPDLSLPEWIKVNEKRVNEYKDFYNETKSKWLDKEQIWVKNLQAKMAGLQNMWKLEPIEGRPLLCYSGKFYYGVTIFFLFLLFLSAVSERIQIFVKNINNVLTFVIILLVL